MSWLSEAVDSLFGGGDDKAKKRRQQEEAARLAAEKAAQEQAQAEWASGLDKSKSGAYGSANDFFTSLGLDPTAYESSIDDYINQAYGGLQYGDDYSQIGGGVGQAVFDQETGKLRARAGGDVDKTFGGNWLDSYITDTVDDEAIANILGEQRGSADEYLQNLYDRGVLTETGYQGGQSEIERQFGAGGDLLSQLGGGLINSARSGFEGIADRAAGDAASASLFGGFDIGDYTSQIDADLASFLDSLEGNLRGQAGDLFSTGGILGKAGVAQGAQNIGQKKNPKSAAVLGQYGEDEEEDDRSAVSDVF